MSTSPKYDWDYTDYETVGWNGILQSFQAGVDTQLNTYIAGTLGATVSKDEVLFLDTDGTYKKAQAAADKCPCQGIAIEAGNSGAAIRMRRIGPYAPTGAASALTLEPGERLYTDPSTAGMWTHSRPSAYAQAIGFALDASNVFVWIEELSPIHFSGTTPATTAISADNGTILFVYTP